MKWIAGIAFAAASTLLFAPTVQAKKPVAFASDDEVFLALRDASRNGDAQRAAELASRLGNYAIPSYVDYFRLRPRIHMAGEFEIRDYLARYEGTAIADRLRNDWLLELGRARNWMLFDEQYPQFVLNDDNQVKCYALTSKALKGQNVVDDARAALVNTQNYGEGCALLITTLVQVNQFTLDDVWMYVRMIAESGFANTLRRIAPVTEANENALVQAYEKPDAVLARGPGNNRASREMFIVALGRSAKNDPSRAVNALVKAAEQLNEREREQAWAQIALQSSMKLAPDAIVYWHRTNGAPLSLDGYQWKARAALRAGEWKLVKSTIEAMPASLRNDPAWIYWMGRAYRAEGNQDEAKKLFGSIADQTNFYGQLALEELDRKVTIPQKAEPVTHEELAPMAENAGFRRALKLFDLNMRFEGYREWNWELRKPPPNSRARRMYSTAW